MPPSKKDNDELLRKHNSDVFDKWAKQFDQNHTDTQLFTTAPKAWLSLLEKVEKNSQRDAIKQILISENMPIDVLSAEVVINKIDVLLRQAHSTLEGSIERSKDGNPKYSESNINHARIISGTSIRMISGIPELDLLPQSGLKHAELPILPPNRRHAFLVDKITDNKYKKELIALLEMAETRIKECIHKTRVLTREDIDVVIADLLGILKYCENELLGIKRMKRKNEVLKEDGANVKERIQELKRFKFPIRRRQLAEIYIQLGAILSNGLGILAVPNSVNNIFAERYTSGIISGIRKSNEKKGQITTKGRDVVDNVLKQSQVNRRNKKI